MKPAVRIENRTATGRILLVCEHASAEIPADLASLGLPEATREAHIAWDPGALGLARGLARRLDAMLIAAPHSRLVYDLNRPPHSPSAMAARSEVFDIPGNSGLTEAERLRRTEELYLPFHHALHAEIARRLAIGRPPVLVTVHSFTPVYHGKPRAVELGVIHDADPTLARAVVEEAKARLSLATALNQPYDAGDGVTHMLRLHATPYSLRNVMLEVRNDLIATPDAQEEMAARLAPVLSAALTATETPARTPTQTPAEGVA
jgi:predicted N-formylglutamate amidohydrolase